MQSSIPKMNLRN